MTPSSSRQQSGDLPERAVIAVALFALGVLVALQAMSYDLGTLRRMGPGYFPLMLGVAQCIFALMIFLTPIPIGEDPESSEAVETGTLATKVRAFILVLSGMIVFASLVRVTGFVVATIAATFVAGLAEPDNSLFDLALLSLGVALFTSLVFVVGLGVPVPLFNF